MSKKKDNKPSVRSAESAVQCEIGKPVKKTTIGGQALIEGVMMVGPSRTCMAVRKGDGTIHVEEVKQSEKVSHFENVPFIRGCIRFYKMLVTGTGALMRSADISEEGKPEENAEEAKSSRLDDFLNRHRNVVVTFAAILGILISVGLFILLPRLIVDVIAKFIPEHLVHLTWMAVVLNVIEGILRMMIFLLYLINASRLKDIKRVWKYHGAEHKTIACYEAGEDLTAENVLKYPRFHPRCGTAFMFIVLAISILIYTVISVFIGSQPMWVNLVVRLVCIPFICSISYEMLRFVGRHDKNGFCRLLCKPGLWLQKFTTDEPDAAIVEVAIASLQAVIPENKEDDVW
ncbi:MAG: DUF1385 domain-containing protein [Ruminococcaceae bacterium]|nr:DUF1385 domain-containing protein [Oscillospiraceae bacterium]